MVAAMSTLQGPVDALADISRLASENVVEVVEFGVFDVIASELPSPSPFECAVMMRASSG